MAADEKVGKLHRTEDGYTHWPLYGGGAMEFSLEHALRCTADGLEEINFFGTPVPSDQRPEPVVLRQIPLDKPGVMVIAGVALEILEGGLVRLPHPGAMTRPFNPAEHPGKVFFPCRRIGFMEEFDGADPGPPRQVEKAEEVPGLTKKNYPPVFAYPVAITNGGRPVYVERAVWENIEHFEREIPGLEPGMLDAAIQKVTGEYVYGYEVLREKVTGELYTEIKKRLALDLRHGGEGIVREFIAHDKVTTEPTWCVAMLGRPTWRLDERS
jgi:hypothetical protein